MVFVNLVVMPSNHGKTKPFLIRSEHMFYVLLTFMQIKFNIGQKSFEGKYGLQLSGIFSHSPELMKSISSVHKNNSVFRPCYASLSKPIAQIPFKI